MLVVFHDKSDVALPPQKEMKSERARERWTTAGLGGNSNPKATRAASSSRAVLAWAVITNLSSPPDVVNPSIFGTWMDTILSVAVVRQAGGAARFGLLLAVLNVLAVCANDAAEFGWGIRRITHRYALTDI